MDILDGMIHYAQQGKDNWLGREKIPEPIRDLLDEFVHLTRMRPTKSDLHGWMAEGYEWLEAGLTRRDLRMAYEKARGPRGFLVCSPYSLTKTAKALKAQGENHEDCSRYVSGEFAEFVNH